jgi:hypothetical protein
MDPSFGTRLRTHRERQQVALSAIAEQTKIKASLLDGLERDDLSRWPGGIFRRSYVRAYAVAIGLEPEAVVREFLDRHPDPDDEMPVMAAVARAADHDQNRRPPTRLGNLISSAIGALPTLRSPSARSERPSATTTWADYGGLDTRAGATEVMEWTEPAASPMPELSMQNGNSEPAADVAYRQELAEAEETVEVVVTQVDATADAPAEDGASDSRTFPDAAPERSDASPDLSLVASLCTRLSRATDAAQIAPVLADAARMLDAIGLMLWTWSAETSLLTPALIHGYEEGLVAQLPGVSPDDDNAIAWAFRSEETRTISGSDLATGALAVPLMSPAGCTGVLALELRHGHERHDAVRAVVEILAAQLSALVGHPPAAGHKVAVNT